ncbi:hypothetical protein HNP65_000528 [Thermosipho japonicus]|uniref:Glycosyltransferase family 1 protein n=1 Tax=Thermosipho japonicus TaxID=90323 RepID=A0A841GEQ4_9BACT|nr:glycosyltransferase [Thermosipho japonicus]MBB6062106.1 hypothetical protein [Thermosipho japonicus]
MISVLHCPVVIANNSVVISKYLQKLGVNSKVISYFKTWLDFKGDINLNLDKYPLPERNKIVKKFFSENIDFFKKFDIIHYHFFDTLTFGTSFGGWNAYPEKNPYWELEYFKNLGKKIVVSSWGSDVRNNSKFVYYQLKFEGEKNLPYPPLNTYNQYFKIWEFSKYSDAIVHGDSEQLKHTPYGIMIPIPFDPESYQITEYNNNFSIIHAPSNKFIKGSKYVLKVFDKLKLKYPKIEFKLITNLKHEEAKKIYSGKGIAIDQINFSIGLFSLESLYFGREVISTVHESEFINGDPKLFAPIHSVFSEKELEEKIEYLINNYSSTINEKRKYVIENFSADKIAKLYKDLYQVLLDNEKIPFIFNQKWLSEFDSVIKNKSFASNYYSKITDILLEKKDYERLDFEISNGINLGDNIELIAKKIFSLRLRNKFEEANKLEKANEKVVNTEKYKTIYSKLSKSLVK